MSVNREQLRETFNRSADIYDWIRPGYPEALFDDVINLSGIPEQGRILEIGCATGKATEPFASRGYSMDCLDIGSDLAAVATTRFREFDNVRIIVSSFEDWEPNDQVYDLVIAATSFHWIDPVVAYVKSAAILKPAGSLAVFSNTHVRKNEGFFSDVQEVYRQHVPEWCQFQERSKPSGSTSIREPGLELFDESTRQVYPWSICYTSEEYVKLLNTYSDHIALYYQKRTALCDGIKNMIDAYYHGRILKHYETILDIRKKRKHVHS